MTNSSTIVETSLAAILQQHFRRFVVSIEFVELVNGQVAIEAVFDDGFRALIKKGITDDYKSNADRPSLTMAVSAHPCGA